VEALKCDLLVLLTNIRLWGANMAAYRAAMLVTDIKGAELVTRFKGFIAQALELK
jgi:hypothetical protein